MRRVLAAATILLPLPAAQGAPSLARSIPYVWRNAVVGGGGFAPGIVFSPVERGLAYLRTDMGGAYRRDSATGRWIPLQDGEGEASYMGVESIAPDPRDPEIVYMAAGMSARQPAAIFRSIDRGAHWRITPVPFAMGGNEEGRGLGERLAVDPAHTSTLFFGSRHDGLWRSDDAGARWSKVTTFPFPGMGLPSASRRTHGGLAFVVFDPTHDGHILVGSADPGTRHLAQSRDGGRSWTIVRGGPSADMLPVKSVAGRDGVFTITYCDAIGPNGIRRGAVWRFAPETGLWTDVTPDRRPAAPAGGYMGVAVSAQDPRVIAIGTVDRSDPVDTVWLSRDAGRNWQELWQRSVRDISASPFLDLDGRANFGHWIAGLAIDPFDANHAAYVTGATLYATQELLRPGGILWRPWTKGIEQTAVITLVSPTDGAPLVSGFGDIAGFRHDDLAVSPPRVHLNPYLATTNTLDYAGCAPSVMVRSGSSHDLTVADTSLAWSADGGATWRPLRPSAMSKDARAPERTGDAAITVSADGGTFLVETRQPLVTGDHGRSWRPVEGLPSRVRVTADKADPRRFYAIDFTGNRLVRSEDGGRHFHPVAGRGLPADLSAARVTWREAQNPLLATPGRAGALWLNIGGTLYRSGDAGETWTRSGGDLAVSYYGLGRHAPDTAWPAIYAIGRRAGPLAVWRSIDGGAHWMRINDDRHQWGLRFRAISGDPRRFGRVYIGTDGRGLLYGDPGASATIPQVVP